ARICALTIGLAATVIVWIFAAAFTPEELEWFGNYSPWLYGPVWTAAWAFFSAIAYLLVSRDQTMEEPHNGHQDYRCRDFDLGAPADGYSICANHHEKNRLGAVTAGFALTISTWVVALSFMPEDWLDQLTQAAPWICSVVSIVVWAASSAVMYLI